MELLLVKIIFISNICEYIILRFTVSTSQFTLHLPNHSVNCVVFSTLFRFTTHICSTECHNQEGSTTASYTRGPGLESWPTHMLSWL